MSAAIPDHEIVQRVQCAVAAIDDDVQDGDIGIRARTAALLAVEPARRGYAPLDELTDPHSIADRLVRDLTIGQCREIIERMSAIVMPAAESRI